MDTDLVREVFLKMEHPPRREAALEIDYVSENYSTIKDDTPHTFESHNDPEIISFEISRFINALEKNRKLVEKTEASCLGISLELASAKLNTFIDHLYYYIACELEKQLLSPFKHSEIILWYEGSVLTVTGQALAQALVSGLAVVLCTYDDFSTTAKHLRKIWTEAGLPEGRFHVISNFNHSLMNSLQIFVGGQLERGPNYDNFKPYFLKGHTNPLLVLDGADIESVVSVVLDKDHVLRHVEPWALSLVIIEESQLPKFKSLLLERCKGPNSQNTTMIPEGQERHIEHIKEYHLENRDAEIHHLVGYRYVVFGSQPSRANRLWHHDLNGSPLFVLPVRSAKEAVAKANHYGSGYVAAVYTEDGSLSQWASEQLNAHTVWINTIGLLHPAAPLPFQVEGNSEIDVCHPSANLLDLLNYRTHHPDFHIDAGSPHEEVPQSFSQEVLEKVKEAVAAQPAWEALGGLGRSKLFFRLFTQSVQRQKNQPDLSEFLERCAASFTRTSVSVKSSYGNQEKGTAVTTYLKPCGVIGIYVNYNQLMKRVADDYKIEDSRTYNVSTVKVIQGAITYGNTCVVILADGLNHELIDLLYGPASCLPKGVVNIIRSTDPSTLPSLLRNMDVTSLWDIGSALPWPSKKRLQNLQDKYQKSIWTASHTDRFALKFFEPLATIKKHVWRQSQSN